MSHVKKPLALAAILNTIIFIAEGIGGIKGRQLFCKLALC